MYKDREDKDDRLYAGPVGDFDQAYGMSEVCSNNDQQDGHICKNKLV